MKKNRMMRLASILLVCVLLTTSVISGTFAKYISTTEGEDVARVAKWDIQLAVGEDDAAQMPFEDDVTVNLFSTAYDNVESANDDKVIAPGTTGRFGFSIQNKSEVTAEYEIIYTLENEDDIPIEFSIDGGNNWTTELNNVTFADTELAIGSEAVEVEILWRWAFEGADSANFTSTQTDETDTELGLAGEATVTVGIAITAQQVD